MAISKFEWLPPHTEFSIDLNLEPPPWAIRWYEQRHASQELALLMAQFDQRMVRLRHNFLFTQIFRTHDEQLKLYAQGRTTPGKIVTDALPWQSAHCHTIYGTPASMAFDIAPKRDGQIYWPMDDTTSRFWSDARDTGKMLGLVWGATFNNPPRDFGHFQLSTFKAIKP